MMNQTVPAVIGFKWRMAIKVVPRKTSFVLGKGMKGSFFNRKRKGGSNEKDQFYRSRKHG
ncbi:hypothetical protein HMPREF0322_04934 [Desulfitobacterium hafniense DP7]|uniref:Uncharacterized protein n=1 Tax=Desulfitobacterium hafniense DP7 TaxID=537010 RepID=G9XVC1_DESHA|nr:hypothetical protein HMPREF0322_04934 [Desulfitobacterium hafniense DP7]